MPSNNHLCLHSTRSMCYHF